MPKRRDQIRMSEEEQQAFLAESKSLQVATLDRHGAPHLTTLWYGLVDGEIVFATFSKSQKIKNLRRDPRIAVLLEDGLTYDKLRGVSIQGRAELCDDPDEVHRYARAIARRNNPGLSGEALEQATQRLVSKRTVVIVKPERVFSWDHTKLGGVY